MKTVNEMIESFNVQVQKYFQFCLILIENLMAQPSFSPSTPPSVLHPKKNPICTFFFCIDKKIVYVKIFDFRFLFKLIVDLF